MRATVTAPPHRLASREKVLRHTSSAPSRGMLEGVASSLLDLGLVEAQGRLGVGGRAYVRVRPRDALAA